MYTYLNYYDFLPWRCLQTFCSSLCFNFFKLLYERFYCFSHYEIVTTPLQRGQIMKTGPDSKLAPRTTSFPSCLTGLRTKNGLSGSFWGKYYSSSQQKCHNPFQAISSSKLCRKIPCRRVAMVFTHSSSFFVMAMLPFSAKIFPCPSQSASSTSSAVSLWVISDAAHVLSLLLTLLHRWPIHMHSDISLQHCTARTIYLLIYQASFLQILFSSKLVLH